MSVFRAASRKGAGALLTRDLTAGTSRVQVVGLLSQTGIDLWEGDHGGELDPNGAGHPRRY